MQYSPKLKMVMEEIKAILNKHDVGAVVVLHEPGASEFLLNVGTSYSCASFDGDNLRIKSKLEDYGGDKQKQLKQLADTVNMMHHLSTDTGMLAVNLIDISSMIDKVSNAEHIGDGGHTSHTQQNN